MKADRSWTGTGLHVNMAAVWYIDGGHSPRQLPDSWAAAGAERQEKPALNQMGTAS